LFFNPETVNNLLLSPETYLPPSLLLTPSPLPHAPECLPDAEKAGNIF
jgi:hypothetical protein